MSSYMDKWYHLSPSDSPPENIFLKNTEDWKLEIKLY